MPRIGMEAKTGPPTSVLSTPLTARSCSFPSAHALPAASCRNRADAFLGIGARGVGGQPRPDSSQLARWSVCRRVRAGRRGPGKIRRESAAAFEPRSLAAGTGGFGAEHAEKLPVVLSGVSADRRGGGRDFSTGQEKPISDWLFFAVGEIADCEWANPKKPISDWPIGGRARGHRKCATRRARFADTA